jgi:hypothetical protein
MPRPDRFHVRMTRSHGAVRDAADALPLERTLPVPTAPPLLAPPPDQLAGAGGRRGFRRDTCRVTVASDPGVDGLQSFEPKSHDRVHTCGFARGIEAEERADRDCERDSK